MTNNTKPNLKLSGVLSFVVALILFIGNQFLGTDDNVSPIEPAINGTIPADIVEDESDEPLIDLEPELEDEPLVDVDPELELEIDSEATVEVVDSTEVGPETAVEDDASDEIVLEEAESTAEATEIIEVEPTPETLLWADADGDFDYYVLALSWQSAFCETRPDKTECRSQTNGRYDATHFILHGLWPNIRNDPGHDFAYCGQSNEIISQDRNNWCELPDLSLADDIAADLAIAMPGAVSCLDKHEWYKHGTCAGMSDDAYFALSNGLVELFGQTEFNRYVADNIGQEVSRNDLLNRFEAEFGEENGDYLSLRCTEVDGVSLLSEIRLVLTIDIDELNDFADLFPSNYIRPNGSCPRSFYIDAVG